MTLQEAIDRATKLLRLAESDNPHEAALAAQRAQEILTRYEIDRTSINLGGTSEQHTPDEEIENFMNKGAPLDAGLARIARWKGMLASAIAKANQARVYIAGNAIGIVGRASDVEKVRYLYAMLVAETDRLTDRDGKGCGVNWRNQYRLGVVDAVREKLAATHAKVAAEMRAENNGHALVRVNQAIAKLAENDLAVDAWMKANMRLRTSRASGRYNPNARAAGREAGKAINISSARGALGAAGKRLKG